MMKLTMKKKIETNIVAYLVNDIHITPKTIPTVKDVFSQLETLCTENDVHWILIGGDVFTARSGQPLQCLIAWGDILTSLQRQGITVSVIPGNHDKTDQDSNESYLQIYGTWPNVHLHEQGEIEIATDKLAFAFVPFYKSNDRWKQEYDRAAERIEDCFREGDIDKNAKTILITHAAINGVRNNDGSEVEDGEEPALFEDWTWVLVGHYHNYSRIGSNIVYTGSAYQGNYGETADHKGFTAIYSDGHIEALSANFPHYVKEVLSVNDREALQDVLTKYNPESSKDYIRLEFHGKNEERNKVNVSELERLGFDVKYVPDEITEAMADSVSETLTNYDKRSLMKDFMKFCADSGIRGARLKYGLDLIRNINIEH